MSLLALLVGACTSVQEKNQALIKAVHSGDRAAVSRMLDKGAVIDCSTSTPRGLTTPLQLALQKSDADIAEVLIDRGASLATKDRFGDTPLHTAIKNDLPRGTIEKIINKGANVNAQGELDDTALHVAVYRNQPEMSSLLLGSGADISALNRYGLRPQDMARLPEIEQQIAAAASRITPAGGWVDITTARLLYDQLKQLPANQVTNALVLQVIDKSPLRAPALLLAIKLGIKDSEEKLGALLIVYGDKSMAEDYLNSGSSMLATSGREWAGKNGYRIAQGPGSHRAGWGQF